MQKWQYLELEVTPGDSNAKTQGHLWFFKPDGKHFENSGKYGKLMAALGADGWELVSSIAGTEMSPDGRYKVNHIFKRPINYNTLPTNRRRRKDDPKE
jgi:hypothetical protein